MGNQSGKSAANRWWFQSSCKKFTLVLKVHILYLSGPLIFFQFNFGTKAYFLLFFNSWFEREERDITGFQR